MIDKIVSFSFFFEIIHLHVCLHLAEYFVPSVEKLMGLNSSASFSYSRHEHVHAL